MSTAAWVRFDPISTDPLPPPHKLGHVSSVAKHGWSYSGIAWTDRDGRAVVNLPLVARLHDAGFEYELASVDSQSSVELTDEIVDGRFAVATDEPHVKVRWRVTAYRSRGDGSRRR